MNWLAGWSIYIRTKVGSLDCLAGTRVAEMLPLMSYFEIDNTGYKHENILNINSISWKANGL
jgi:hypothetical protein